MVNKIANYIKDNKAICIILLIAAVLRFYKINFQSLWMDEIYTMNITNPDNSFSDIITEVNTREGFPYLYFLLLKVLYTVFGYSAIVARGLSAAFGVFSVFAVFKLGDKLYSKKAGLFAALLLTFSEHAIYISQDARPYTIYLFCVILSYYGLITFLKEVSLRNAIKYGVLAGLLLNFNFFGLVNLLAQFIVAVLFLFLFDKSERINYIKKSALVAFIAVLFFVPNIYKLTTLFGVTAPWIPKPTNESFTILLKEFVGNSEMTLFFFVPLFFYFLITLFKKEEVKMDNSLIEDKEMRSFVILFSWSFVFVLFIMTNSYWSSSLLIPRYFVSMLPVIVLLIGISFAMIRNSVVRTLFATGLLVFMFFNLIVVRGHYRGVNKTQFREASQLILDNNKNNDPVYTSLKYWFDYYLNTKTVKTNVIEMPNIDAVIAEMMADPSKIKPFWYTDAHGRPIILSEASQQFVNSHFYIDNNYDGFDAWTKHFILLKDVPRNIDISKYDPIQTYNGSPFPFSIEAFENTNGLVKVSGWAYFDRQDATETTIDLLLIKDGKTAIRMLTQKVSRPDVTSYFKSSFDLSNSGFSSTINLSELEKGTYQIGVFISNKKEGKEGLNISDKVVENK
jgi:4-amino-4-deoxy-L-arabinose transferase-like glycosyltransferase